MAEGCTFSRNTQTQVYIRAKQREFATTWVPKNRRRRLCVFRQGSLIVRIGKARLHARTSALLSCHSMQSGLYLRVRCLLTKEAACDSHLELVFGCCVQEARPFKPSCHDWQIYFHGFGWTRENESGQCGGTDEGGRMRGNGCRCMSPQTRQHSIRQQPTRAQTHYGTAPELRPGRPQLLTQRAAYAPLGAPCLHCVFPSQAPTRYGAGGRPLGPHLTLSRSSNAAHGG